MATRSGFSSRLGFVAAAAGSAVGLGNIWRFPYETGENGGAAFLFIYLVCTFLICFPILLGEIAIGRHTQKNPYGAYNQLGGKRWALLGFFGVLCGVMTLSFYNVVAGWAFGYFTQTAFAGLLGQADFGAFFSGYVANVGNVIFFSFLFLAVTAFIVIRGVSKGIEAASKILMPFLFFLLIVLIIYALTLPGAGEGVSFYLKPDLSKITITTVYSALGHAFFSLSLGMGALITYGSYLNKKENLVTAAISVTIADVSVAFLAGLMIFPFVFSRGLEPTAGPGLVFVVLPGVFQSMGAIGPYLGTAFFFLLSVAALTSTISLLEVPVAYVVDEWKWSRKKAGIVLALMVFCIGIPSMLSVGAVPTLSEFVTYEGTTKSFMDLIEDLFLNIGLPLGGWLMTIFIALKWKTSNLSAEIMDGNSRYKGSFIEKFVNFMIVYICPVLLGLIFFVTITKKFIL